MNQNESPRSPVCITVAVTGGAGSGKSLVCRRLVHLGGHLIDADQITREVVMPGTEGLRKVVDRFGLSVLAPDGTLNRAEMRRRIVSDERARKALEAIVHPETLSLMKAKIQSAVEMGHEMLVVEVPLLFELDMASHFDKVVLVKVRSPIKVKRLMERDHVSKTDAKRLLNLQMPDEDKEKLADIVIENNGSMAELIKNVDRLHKMFYLIINNRRRNNLTSF